MASFHRGLQRRLLAASARGDRVEDTLQAVLADDGLCPLPADLRRRLLAGPAPAAALLASIANASCHPCPLGMLSSQILAGSLMSGAELLAAVPAADLAAAIAGLHAAASSGTLAAAARGAAGQAFNTVLKMLVTCAGSESVNSSEGQQLARRALQQLRSAWTACSGGGGGTTGGSSGGSSAEGAALLAAAIDVVDAEVFPRHLACSWLAAELGSVLRLSDTAVGGGRQPLRPQSEAAAEEGEGEAAAWAAAMAAFAAALPLGALLQQVQQAVWAGCLHVPRAAALLEEAAAQQQAAGAGGAAQIERWVEQQAGEAVQQVAAVAAGGALRSLMLLQRERLLLAASGQPELQQQQYRDWFYASLLAAPQPQQPPPPPQQQPPQQQQHLQFLVQHVLIPMLPEDEPCWLQAQADALSVLVQQQQHQNQQQAAALPAGAAQAIQDYQRGARQRLKAEQQQQSPCGGGGGAAAGRSHWQIGEDMAAGLLQEFASCGGQLRQDTLARLLAKMSSLFTSGDVQKGLAPFLLTPTCDAGAMEQRTALMQYLSAEMAKRGDRQVKRLFSPGAVARYRQRCLQAQLEAASLQELAHRAAEMLLLPGAAAAADDGSGDDSSGAGAGAGSGSGGIGAHRLLDRMGQLVEAHLQQWQEQQQQQKQRRLEPSPAGAGGGVRGSAGAGAGGRLSGKSTSSNFTALGPGKLAGLLLGTWTAAYAAFAGSSSSSGGGSSCGGGAGPSLMAVAAQVLGIAHRQPALHEPLLRQLRQQLLQPGEQPEGGAEQQQTSLAAAAMLATTAGALVQRAQQQQGWQPLDGLAGPQAVDDGAAALQPLFVWRLPGLPGQPSEVPGPLWLHQLLSGLPLGSGRGMATAAAAAAAHTSCLLHFRRYALLPEGSNGGGSCDGGDALLVHWRRPARAPHMAASLAEGGSVYAGEWAASLVAPACAAALRLQQWLLLRLGVARQLLGLGGNGPGGSIDPGERAAKRPRAAAVPAAEAAAAAAAAAASGGLPRGSQAVLQACAASLQSDLGAALAEAAGKLPFSELLRLEAAAGAAAGGDLLPLGASEAAFRLCCALYLEPAGPGGAAAGPLALCSGLIQPLAAAASDAGGGGGDGGSGGPAADKVILDSEEEEHRTGSGAAAPAGATLEGLAAAVAAAVVSGSAGCREEQASLGATGVCQRACAHLLRLLAAAAPPGAASLSELLGALLCSLAQQCRQQLALEASTYRGSQQQQQPFQQAPQPQLLLGFRDRQAAEAVGQSLAALARGLLLELLPLPLGSAAQLERQRRRLAAVAEAVHGRLDDIPRSSSSLQQRLAAALAD